MPVRLRIGAPVYRMQVHGGHAGALIELGVHAADHEVEIIGPHYEHTSLLPAGRAKILADAIKPPAEEGDVPLADFLVSIDADTWIDARELLWLVQELATRPAWSIVGVVVPQDDGRVNAWSSQGERLPDPGLRRFVPAWAVGGAICVFNLWWYREIAARVGDAWPWITYAVVPTGAPSGYVGEDTWHCRQVADHGGKVEAIRLDGVKHAAFTAIAPRAKR